MPTARASTMSADSGQLARKRRVRTNRMAASISSAWSSAASAFGSRLSGYGPLSRTRRGGGGAVKESLTAKSSPPISGICPGSEQMVSGGACSQSNKHPRPHPRPFLRL